MGGPRRSTPIVALIAVLGLGTAASCSSEPDTPPPSPSPLLPGGTAPGIATGPTSTDATDATGTTATGPTGLPTTSPGSATGNLRRGRLELQVTGDVRTTKVLPQMISTVYDAPPGGLALVWVAGGADPSTVGIGGLSFAGTQPTATTLTLTIAVPTRDGGFETFTSFDGECFVTIAVAAVSRIAGSIDCADLASSTGVTIDATATFAASG